MATRAQGVARSSRKRALVVETGGLATEVYGIQRVRYLFCWNIMPLIVFAIISSRPFDLLQHPKELARQITLIDHGMIFDLIHIFDYI